MTLKDLFAIHAMQGILERGNKGVDPKTLAEQAYEVAFAMWEERERLAEDHRFHDSNVEVEVDKPLPPSMIPTREWPR